MVVRAWDVDSESWNPQRHPSLGFDGNYTDALTNWIFAEDGFEGLSDRGLAVLTEITWKGNLSWAVFVPAGYRL